MIKDIQTAIAFTNLSDVRRDRLSALIAGADRAWRVVERCETSGRSVYTTHNGTAHIATFHAFDTQKASARLLRLGRR